MVAIQQQEKPVNYKALAWTIGVHCLLFLSFFLLRYTYPFPPPVDMSGGMEVNLGTSDDGSGDDQPQSTKAPAEFKATVVYKATPAKSALPQNIMQTTAEDAPEVATKTTTAKRDNLRADTKPETKPKQVQEKPKYSYAGETGEGGNSASQNRPGTSEGNGSGPGDKGVPGGTPGADNYSGSPGNGNGGMGHNLKGRQIYPDRFEAEFNESGKVVVHVTVDRNGNIINKYVKTSSSSQLNKIALEQLNNVKFSKSASPEPQQFGDVTIIFKTRQ